MKKIVIPIVLIVIALIASSIAIFAFTLQEDAIVEKLDTVETLSKVATSENGNFSIVKLNQKEIFYDLSAENLANIMTAFDVIIDKNEVIELTDEYFVHYLLYNNDIEHDYPADVITVSTDIDKDILKYAMFTSVFLENFPETVFRFYDSRLFDELGAPSGKRNNRIAISFDFIENGYDNAFDYISQFYVGNITELGDKTFLLSYDDPDIYIWNDNNSIFPSPNLLEFMSDSDCSRILDYQRTRSTKVHENK